MDFVHFSCYGYYYSANHTNPNSKISTPQSGSLIQMHRLASHHARSDKQQIHKGGNMAQIRLPMWEENVISLNVSLVCVSYICKVNW
jgi:hypothetical protein